MIGAWLIYQIQNNDLYGKDSYESLFLKATIAYALGCTLSNFVPIDDWSVPFCNIQLGILSARFLNLWFCRTHFGAAFTGLAYGFFTCSTVQLDDKASESGQEEGIRLVSSSGNPCKSLVCLSIFILLWTSLVFMNHDYWPTILMTCKKLILQARKLCEFCELSSISPSVLQIFSNSMFHFIFPSWSVVAAGYAINRRERKE